MTHAGVGHQAGAGDGAGGGPAALGPDDPVLLAVDDQGGDAQAGQRAPAVPGGDDGGALAPAEPNFWKE